MRTVVTYTLLALLAIFIAPAVVHATLWLSEGHPRNWRNADWSSAGTLPSPSEEREASIRVMAARTGGLKGAVSVHTWLLLKPEAARNYERYEVVGWGSPVRRNGRPPDGRWYSNEPVAIYTLKGTQAARLIPKVEAAIRDYRWSERGAYRIWPGPNSNTFVATCSPPCRSLALSCRRRRSVATIRQDRGLGAPGPADFSYHSAAMPG